MIFSLLPKEEGGPCGVPPSESCLLDVPGVGVPGQASRARLGVYDPPVDSAQRLRGVEREVGQFVDEVLLDLVATETG